jgi:hypothetical protein
MHVVGHQTPPEEPDTRVAQSLPQVPKIRLAAFIGREGLAPVHPTLCDVASNPRQHTSVSSWDGAWDTAERYAELPQKLRSSG